MYSCSMIHDQRYCCHKAKQHGLSNRPYKGTTDIQAQTKTHNYTNTSRQKQTHKHTDKYRDIKIRYALTHSIVAHRQKYVQYTLRHMYSQHKHTQSLSLSL